MTSVRHSLRDFVFQTAKQGDPKTVIDAIDQFAWTKHWLMNIGDEKGSILDRVVRENNPKFVLELGTYLGYSSLRIIRQLSSDAKFISIEADRESALIARSIHDFAGTSHRVTIVNQYSDQIIPKMKEKFDIDSFDLIFIDHHNDFYLRDLKLLEDNHLIRSGTVLFADNVITPGAPQYVDYIRHNRNYVSNLYETKLEYRTDVRDGIELSIRK